MLWVNNSRILLVIVLLGLVISTRPANAFDKDGHRIVAMISYAYMFDETKQALEDLLGSNIRQEWIGSAYWAAEETEKSGNEWMEALHRVWFDPADRAFDPDKHCRNNRCAAGAVLESEYVLTHDEYSAQEQRQALKFLLHFLADLHQPTNCGFVRDQSGQKILLKGPDLNEVNLHWIWQTGLREKEGQRWSTLAIELIRDMDDELFPVWTSSMDPVEWAWECHQLARSSAYIPALEKKWGNGYFNEAWPVYQEQLQKAGYRLATLLNNIYAPEVMQKMREEQMMMEEQENS